MVANSINIGIGLGKLKFGMNESYLTNFLGPAPSIETAEYGYNVIREYIYKDKGISFSFSSEEGFKLVSIEFFSDFYDLKGITIVGISLHQILKELELKKFSKPKIDSISNEFEENHLMLYYEDESVTISLINYTCDSFVIGPLWDSNNAIIWPTDQ